MEPLIDPHLNADVYRNMTAADRPPIHDGHLQFLLIFNEKSAILGGSNMTDRYWNGTIWYYTNLSDFDREKASLAIRTESGVCAAGYIEEDKFVVGEDSGALQVIGVVEAADTHLKELKSLGYACHHDDSLVTLSVFDDKKQVVTGGTDCCIKVWDIEDLVATHTFSFAHANSITCVDTIPNSTYSFVSTSLDHEATLWDVRQSGAAHRIFLNKEYRLTACSAAEDNIVALGDTQGNVIFVDIRNNSFAIVNKTLGFLRPVCKLVFNPNTKRSLQLAGCCDGTVVKVFDAYENLPLMDKDLPVVYENDMHKDFVSGLAWHENDLLSCSWDNTVLKHTTKS